RRKTASRRPSVWNLAALYRTTRALARASSESKRALRSHPEPVRPPARTVQDRKDLDPLAQPVKSDIGRAGDDQPAGIPVTQQSPEHGMPCEYRHGLDDAAQNPLRCANVIESDIGTYILEVLQGVVQPDDFIRRGRI